MVWTEEAGWHMRRRLVAVVLVGLVVSLGAVVAAAGDVPSAASTDDEPSPASTRPRLGGWPEDVDGDGIISDSGAERIPVLIKAVGDHGTEGYVRFDDLEGGPQPATPEEAVQMSGRERVIDLYAEDGSTVLDTYTLVGS